MIEEITTGTVAGGVIASFFFDALKHLSIATIKNVAPSAFRGSHRLLAEADREFEVTKNEILARHSDNKTLDTFLSPEKTIKGGVLNPLFENIFCGATLDKRKITDAYLDCSPTGRHGTLRKNAEKITNDIIDSIKYAFLTNPKLSAFVLHACLQEIRASFETVNILNKLLSASSPRPFFLESDVDEFARDYLCDLKRQVRNLIINGLDAATRKERVQQDIIQAFVPISLNSCVMAPFTNASSFNPFACRENAYDVISQIPRLIIRGPAGSGKTTLLHWVISHCEPFERDKSPSLPYLPIYIPLRRLEGVQNFVWEINNIFFQIMANDELKRRMPHKFFDLLQKHTTPILFMFDGVDEITEQNRDLFWKCISMMCDRCPHSHIVITSRNLSICHLSNGAYRDDIYVSPEAFIASARQWRPPVGFLEFVVAPLSSDDIVSFVDSWFMGVDESLIPYNQQQEIKTFPKKLKSTLFLEQNRAVLELSRTPLLCSLICMVFFLSGGRLPRNRRGLYDLSTRLLVETRDEYRNITIPISFRKITQEKRLAILRSIALSMQEGIDPHSSEQSIEVDKSVVLEWIRSWNKDNALTFLTAEEVLNFLIERCSLLREPANNRIDFIHRSFMEYLAANEVVVHRNPYSLRTRIKDDQWLCTLQFCMETETGGDYFAGALAAEIIKYLCESGSLRKSNRGFFLRVAALLSFCKELPAQFSAEIRQLAGVVLPPSTLSEVHDCAGIPFEFMREFLEFEKVKQLAGDSVYLAGVLLSEHEDERCSGVIATGYENHPDVRLIGVINECGRVPVSKHYALQQRIRNGSYKKKVFFRADDFNEPSLRPLIARKIGIRFPLNANNMLGWGSLRDCQEVTLIEARRHDWDVMLSSKGKDGFGNARYVEIENCVEFSIDDVAKLFPVVEMLIIVDCHSFDVTCIEKLENLEIVEFVAIRRPIDFQKVGSLGKVREIILRNCGDQPHAAALMDRGVHVSIEFS